MFNKVLVVEDFDVINKGIVSSLKEIGTKEIEYITYCDEAYLKIRNAHQNNMPFDLIISDLSFPILSSRFFCSFSKEIFNSRALAKSL